MRKKSENMSNSVVDMDKYNRYVDVVCFTDLCPMKPYSNSYLRIATTMFNVNENILDEDKPIQTCWRDDDTDNTVLLLWNGNSTQLFIGNPIDEDYARRFICEMFSTEAFNQRMLEKSIESNGFDGTNSTFDEELLLEFEYEYAARNTEAKYDISVFYDIVEMLYGRDVINDNGTVPISMLDSLAKPENWNVEFKTRIKRPSNDA